MAKIASINPSNYQKIGEVEVSTTVEVASKVKSAHEAQKTWQELGLADRIALLKKAFAEFAKRKEEFALLQSKEMGMPLTDTLQDIDDSIGYANWYFDNAAKYLNPETTYESNKEIHQVFYEPIGVAAVIVPWNFPFANFVWGALQSLIAGNTVVFKHSEEVPLCGKLLEDVLSKYLPEGVFNEVYGDGEVGKQLVAQDIDMIAFTGSTKTGKFLYETAGKKFIKAVMELGGSAPGLIFEDADINLAVSNTCDLRLLNAGQCCDGLKRLIVHHDVVDQVIEKLKTTFAAKKVGNAENKNTQVGPLVAKRQLELLVAQVEDAIAKGAKVVCGGKSLEKEMGGAFFEPTILTGITKEMRVWNEEVFGPVLPVIAFKDEAQAIRMANDTNYGLGAYVFTKDKDRAKRVAEAIKSGMVGINGTNYIMPFDPFGGYKNSGFGREHGKYGFHEVTQIKVIAREK